MRTLRSWEVAEILGVSEKTVTRYLQRGIIPGAKLGKFWHVDEEALAEALRGGGEGTFSPHGEEEVRRAREAATKR
jgi:excisionase family DNA binding protein